MAAILIFMTLIQDGNLQCIALDLSDLTGKWGLWTVWQYSIVFLFRFACIKLVFFIWFLQIWPAIYVYGTMINWSTLIKKLMQMYIVIVSGSILNVSTVNFNDIWHLIWRYHLKPVLGGHPVLSGHYIIPRGCPLNTGFTVFYMSKGTFVVTSYSLSPLVRFQNLGIGIWNSALNNSWIPGTITEFWNPSFTDRQVICAIQNPRLSWTNLHGLSLRLQGWDLILSPCSVLPRYLRLGGLPGLIHWKIVDTWLKNQRFSQRKLTLTSRTKILNTINGKQKGKACQNKLNYFSTVEERENWWKSGGRSSVT